MADNQTFDASQVSIRPLDEVDALELRDFLVAAQKDFWGDRDLSQDHDPYWFRQFAASGLVARFRNEIVGYLLGVIPLEGPAYVHLVAARHDFRHQGIGRRLYSEFIQMAREKGATEVQATADQDNSEAISFHSSMGFEGELIADYGGPGTPRVFFCRFLNGD